MAAITIDKLTKRFGSALAVDDLSFVVEPGTVTGFVGPNGAGKTTTMRCLLGLARASSGSATFDGKPYSELDDPLGSVGVVLEGASFYPGRTGRDHLRVMAKVGRIPETRVDEVLALVGLGDYGRNRVRTYSMGMKQRLAMGTALLGDPKVLVLDEPANGLDPEGIRWMREFLRYHASTGGTVLISSHVLSEVSLAADEVVILNKGKLVKIAALEELTSGASPRTRVRTPDPARFAELLRARGADVENGAEDALLVRWEPEDVGRLAAENGIVLYELVRQQQTLEEAFFEATGATRPEEAAS